MNEAATAFRRESIDEVRGPVPLERVAADLGVSFASVRNWRAGRCSPSFENVCALAALYSKPLEFFMTKGGEASEAA